MGPAQLPSKVTRKQKLFDRRCETETSKAEGMKSHDLHEVVLTAAIS